MPAGTMFKADTCILHIGVPKTGSTSIQKSLFEASGQLAERGFLYPTVQRVHKFLVSTAMETPEKFDVHRQLGRDNKAAQEHDAQLCAQLGREMADRRPHTLVLSAEHCVLLKLSEVSRLRDYLLTLAQEVQVYAYARHPGYQLPSLIQEQVKNGARRLSELREAPPFMRYQSILGKFVDVFGKDAMHLRAFPGDPPWRSDVVRDFLDWTGIWTDEDPVASLRANESLSATALVLADALSELAPKFSGRRAAQPFLNRIEGPKMAVDSELLSALLEIAAPEIAYLEDNWGLTLAAPEPGAPDHQDLFGPDSVRSVVQLINDLALELRRKRT